MLRLAKSQFQVLSPSHSTSAFGCFWGGMRPACSKRSFVENAFGHTTSAADCLSEMVVAQAPTHPTLRFVARRPGSSWTSGRSSLAYNVDLLCLSASNDSELYSRFIPCR